MHPLKPLDPSLTIRLDYWLPCRKVTTTLTLQKVNSFLVFFTPSRYFAVRLILLLRSDSAWYLKKVPPSLMSWYSLIFLYFRKAGNKDFSDNFLHSSLTPNRSWLSGRDLTSFAQICSSPYSDSGVHVMNRLFILSQNPNNPNNPIIDQINYLINRTRIPF
jgi:hypothetical protein